MLTQLRSLSLIVLYYPVSNRVLHSFPTRRSSDLSVAGRTDSCSSLCFCVRRRFLKNCVPFLPCGLQIAGMAHSFSGIRSEEHTSELQSRFDIVCRLLLEKKIEIELGILNVVVLHR